MSTPYHELSAESFLPHYREMAADGVRIAQRAASPVERERYLLAAEYWNGRAEAMEKALHREQVHSGASPHTKSTEPDSS